MDLYAITSQEILERISRHCPDAMCTYLACMNRVDDSGKIIFTRDIVEFEMSCGWTKFKNHIKKLAVENLLEWHPMDDHIHVTLANQYGEDE